MQQFCTYGSVRGALANRRPYRDRSTSFRRDARPPEKRRAQRRYNAFLGPG